MMKNMYTQLWALWHCRHPEVKENYHIFRIQPKTQTSWLQFFHDDAPLKKLPSVSKVFIADLVTHLDYAITHLNVTPPQVMRIINHFYKDMLLHGYKSFILDCLPEMIECRDLKMLNICAQLAPTSLTSMPTDLLLEMVPLNQWSSSSIRQRILYPLKEQYDQKLFQIVRHYVEKNESILWWMLKQPYLVPLATHLTPKAIQYLKQANQPYYKELCDSDEKNRFSLDGYLEKISSPMLY